MKKINYHGAIMPFVKPFRELGKNNAAIAGGKGASLGEMTQAGIPVPPGFVVLASAFEKFITETDIDVEIDAAMHTVRHGEIHTVDAASEKIKDLILKAEMPVAIAREIKESFKTLNSKFIAVRSSATAEDSASAAWAGQLDSFLNTTEENLLENVKKCWASLFTPRAIFYRFEKFGDKTHLQKISVAVVVQKMVESEMSGIAFSVHPVTQDYNQLIIEAGLGLGEAIVSGQITPDSYVVEKTPRRILDKNVVVQTRGMFRGKAGGSEWREVPKEHGEPPSLSDEQIFELSDLILKIENHYGFPCDIEWAYEKGKFYIVQSRPITTLAKKNHNVSGRKIILEELVHIDGPLALVELHYEKEAERSMPWANEEFTVYPYIFYERKNGQVYLYYDSEGIAWQMKHAGLYKNVSGAIEKIRAGFDKIKNIIEEEKTLPKKEFVVFLKNVKAFWPWLNYMWWAIEDKEKHGLSVDKLMKMRKYTEYFTPGITAVIRNFIKTAFPDKKRFVDVITLKEALSGHLPSEESLEKRLQTYAYTNHRLYDAWKDVANKYQVEIKETPASDNLLGQVAYPGLIKGIVKIISNRDEVGVFQRGNILVASTTTPDFLPAMKKASAIISEHGGAICHAAITSRELKIPCVVGVKFATQVLQDGDLVEVDAERGLVTILERAEPRTATGTGADKGVVKVLERVGKEESLVKKFKKEIGNDELLVIRGKFIPLFLMTDWLRFYDEGFQKKEGIYPVLSIKRDNLFTHYISLDKYLEISHKAIERYIQNPDYKDKIYDRYKAIKDRVDSFYRNYFRDKPSEESGLLKILETSEEYLHELVALTLFIDFLDSDIVQKTYTENGFNLDFKKIFKVSEIYDFPSFDLKNDAEIINAANSPDYLKHVYTGYSAAPTTEEVKKKLSKLDFEMIGKEIESSKTEIKKKTKAKKKLRDKLNPNEKLVTDFLSWVIELRDDRKPLINKLDVLLNESVRALYKNWGIKENLSFVSYAHEVSRGKEFVLNKLENIEKRQGDFINLYHGDNYVEKYRDLEEEFAESRTLEKPRGDQKSVTGTVANKGKAQGFARIIYDPRKFHSFTEGDILVTSMTRPEFVPIMKKASAIVTNEGGIACHAAIVSRELNKPCVIGTKNATEVIRDGDLVEVDAERGIVQIIERAKSRTETGAGADKGVVRILERAGD
ncbi:MAG: hypothetical protein HYT46_02300 [Candidatus Vogelbacteria bacterium]|nr:hypothetical protein [Candidatus Vogelbacteria bacterium]